MTTHATAYADGYRKGYSERLVEVAGRDLNTPGIGLVEAMRQTAADDAGSPMSNEDLGSFWAGFYHGRSHARNGQPPPAARLDDVPPELMTDPHGR